jgi:class 3 adenylate cyclase
MNDETQHVDAYSSFIAHRSALRAVACALAMQAAMEQFTTITTPVGTTIALAIKVAVVTGMVRRFLVGDPEVQLIEVLAGQTLDELARGEHLAQRGEVLVQAAIVESVGSHLRVVGWRSESALRQQFALVSGLTRPVPPAPWPDLPPDGIAHAQVKSWLLPPVYERVHGGKSEFLSELRPVAALFLMFEGLDYDEDAEAGIKLNAFVRWVQAVLRRYGGALLQLTMGDKGSYLYAAFGAPIAHEDDPARAVAAALELQSPPAELPFIMNIKIGVTYGQMRAGAYGDAIRRTYGVLGDKTNLAARLMQAASDILCDEAIYRATQAMVAFEVLLPIMIKGKTQPVAIYRPLSKTPQSTIASRIDQLAPAHQLTLKIASVIGQVFTVRLLRAIYPSEADKPLLGEHLQTLAQLGLVVRHPLEPHTEGSYTFNDPLTQETSYGRLLFAQRRQLHRAVAEWYERTYADDLVPYYPLLAQHWGKAEDMAKAIPYLERAGEQAQQRGDYQEAIRYFNESLALNAQAAVLSAAYYAANDPDRPSPLQEDRSPDPLFNRSLIR